MSRAGVPVLAAVLAVVGAALLLPWSSTGAAARGPHPVLLTASTAGLFVVSGLFVAHLRYGREGQEVSLRDLAIALGLALLPPLAYVVVHVAGALAPRVGRRMAPRKLVFNAGLFLAEAGLGVAVYRSVLGRADPASGRGLAAGLLAVAVVDLLGSLSVSAVIALSSGHAHRPAVRGLALSQLTAVAGGTVGLLAVVLVLRVPAALPLLVVVLAVLYLACQSQFRLARGNERLEVLYGFAGAAGQAVGDDTVAHTVLAQTRRLMSAEVAELHLLDPEGLTTGTALRLSEGGLSSPPQDGPDWWADALDGVAVHRRRGTSTAGPHDALAAPLYRDGVVMGALVVVERMGAEAEFEASDARVFGALAATAAVSLHNAGLVGRLRHEAVVRELSARQDPLTGLNNRLGFREAVQRRLDPGPAVVVVIDVAGFQEVNDALGQGFGDELLVALGRRLSTDLDADVVARLSADVYAVLLSGSCPVDSAARVEASLQEPFAVGQVRLPVQVRSGIALLPRDGTDPEVLLRRADLALHRAKREHLPTAAFEARDETDSSERLLLVGDLREALAADHLRVHYQPQLDVRTHRVVGVEALVRWTSHSRGAVPPDVFVPLAESAGLVDELTAVVLRAALRDTRRWREAGLLHNVSVNLSARSLTPGLPAVLAEALRVADLPAEALTLELTETAVLAHPESAALVLRELSDLGCSLSLDDFGTGYSSLSFLRMLPLDEIKIDKSFVLQMASHPEDAAVVRATIALAHDLGMRVVAEGVEDAATLAVLEQLGCDGAQGWHIARPAAADRLTPWLRQQQLLEVQAG